MFNEQGDLVVTEKRFVLRQVGWLGQTGKLYNMQEDWKETERGGVSPVYIQVSDD